MAENAFLIMKMNLDGSLNTNLYTYVSFLPIHTKDTFWTLRFH